MKKEEKIEEINKLSNVAYQDFLNVCDRIKCDKSRTGIEAFIALDRAINYFRRLARIEKRWQEKWVCEMFKNALKTTYIK